MDAELGTLRICLPAALLTLTMYLVFFRLRVHLQQHQIDDMPTVLSMWNAATYYLSILLVQKTMSSIQAKFHNAFLMYSSLLACSIGIKHGRVSEFEF